MTNDEQQELWSTERKFVRVLFSMVDDGDLKKIGPAALAVMTVVRRYTPISGVHAFPAVKKIMDKTGLTAPTVRKALGRLCEAGYLEHIPDGTTKSKKFKVNERYVATKLDAQEDNPPKAILVADYNISKQQEINKALTQFERTGTLPENQQIIKIDSINIQINNLADGSVVSNVWTSPDSTAIREAIRSNAKNRKLADTIIRAFDSKLNEVEVQAISSANDPKTPDGED
mgnify:CR=1 FL=1